MEIENSSKYNGFWTKQGNYIWAAALGLAWNQLIDNFTKQPIRVQSNSQNVQKMVENFNYCKFSKKDIDAKSIYVKSGYGQKTVDIINQQSKKKFPEKSFKNLQVKLGENDIISYAYLLKKLEFEKKFTKNEGKNFYFNETEAVQSFSASQKKQKQQILYLYYENQDKFLITIKAKNPNDQIYILKDSKIQNIDDAINNVLASEKKARNELDKDDIFEMPIVDFDVKRQVQQLKGVRILNKSLQSSIGYVYEGIKLKIDESGAKVENEAVIMLLGCVMSQKQPKQFLLNKSFWVIMKQKSKHPYLCAYINNPMEKAQN